MKYNRIIMFCDYGLDDAIATLHILEHSDMFEYIDIVPIGGNVNVQTAYRNAHALLSAASADKSKVRIVDTRKIPQSAADIPDVHGKDGIGDVLDHKEADIPIIDFDSFKNELKSKAMPHRDCVLSLGPCTLPILLGYTPFCTVLMGGTNKEQPNYGKYEFNEAMDVAAFEAFAKTATAVATLDTCHDKKFDFDSFTMRCELANKLIEQYLSLCKSRSATTAIYDYVAALAVTDPELFEAERIERADGVQFNELIYLGK
ncbi:MAG: nucleoside hydrolase [Clostridiales bacterium]|nr:nucleoside hydrolase [Clostridiales bacterium]